jgi:hypothetical protein
VSGWRLYGVAYRSDTPRVPSGRATVDTDRQAQAPLPRAQEDREPSSVSADRLWSAASILALQRAAGNRFTAAVLQRSTCGPGCACDSCAQQQVDATVQTSLLDDAKGVASGVGKFVGNAIDTAESTLAELGKLGTCGPKLALLAGGLVSRVQELLLRHVRDRTMPGAADANELLPVVEKAIIDGTCDCLTDEIVTAVALHVYLAGEPLAQEHLKHYLNGGGAPYVEDITDLFARNPTVRANVGNQVGYACKDGTIRAGVLEGGADLPDGGHVPGSPPITQLDFDDQDWRNAIGNVDKLEWAIISGPDAAGQAQVRITLTDAYAWHGKEARISQCLHQALENMKAKGAADYTSTGSAIVALDLSAAFVDKEPVGPR